MNEITHTFCLEHQQSRKWSVQTLYKKERRW